jgi:hypothetical protein
MCEGLGGVDMIGGKCVTCCWLVRCAGWSELFSTRVCAHDTRSDRPTSGFVDTLLLQYCSSEQR